MSRVHVRADERAKVITLFALAVEAFKVMHISEIHLYEMDILA